MRGSTLLLATLLTLSLASTAEVARESAPANRTTRPPRDTTHHLAPVKLYRGGVLDTIVVRAVAPSSPCVSTAGIHRTRDTTCAVGARAPENARSRE
jgi:hypothetical protein